MKGGLPHDIDIISRFSKLRSLEIINPPLNGRYPALFNFPLLQKLRMIRCYQPKWDLAMLAGLPLLKELDCNCSSALRDNENLDFFSCHLVEGHFMDLAGFPRLKELDLRSTAVRGDIRNFGEGHFPALESLSHPDTAYGGEGHTLQRISDAPDVIGTLYSIRKQRSNLRLNDWHADLSKDSPIIKPRWTSFLFKRGHACVTDGYVIAVTLLAFHVKFHVK